ncbi:hypothetical protein MIC448_1640016 [Microbacterium sp. C448]|nr:hypothetical protein MIC448_1640016 [Microbacterium sp. C448]
MALRRWPSGGPRDVWPPRTCHPTPPERGDGWRFKQCPALAVRVHARKRCHEPAARLREPLDGILVFGANEGLAIRGRPGAHDLGNPGLDVSEVIDHLPGSRPDRALHDGIGPDCRGLLGERPVEGLEAMKRHHDFILAETMWRRRRDLNPKESRSDPFQFDQKAADSCGSKRVAVGVRPLSVGLVRVEMWAPYGHGPGACGWPARGHARRQRASRTAI